MTVIAIDGPAAAGKGTLGRKLAAHYGFAYLDTGTLYRAVALAVLEAGINYRDEDAVLQLARRTNFNQLMNKDLRTEATGHVASVIAAMPRVRETLVDVQRDFAMSPPRGKKGAVLDGRDIGTVICPKADVKLFITASPEARARRRLKDEEAKGQQTTLDAVLAEVRRRDARDSGRHDAPMVAASDAHLLDTTDLSIEAAFERAKALIDGA